MEPKNRGYKKEQSFLVPRLSLVAMPIYNTWEVVRKSLSALLEFASSSSLFLIYNHPPEPILDKIKKLTAGSQNVTILIPPTNYGVTRSLNWAFSHATHERYLFKVDDDTIVPKGFIEKMVASIKTFDEVAFVCASSNAEQVNENFKVIERNGVSLKVYDSGCLSFSCMGLSKGKYELLGPLSAEYRILKEGVWQEVKGERLYGGEEAYYAKRAREENLLMAKLDSVYAQHQDNEEKDFEYIVWKMSYGYFGTIDVTLDELKKDKNLLIKEIKRLCDFGVQIKNNWYIERSLRRLESLGVGTLMCE